MRALFISLSIAFLLPLKGWGFTVRFEDRSASRKSAFSCMIGQLSGTIVPSKPSLFDKTYFVTPQSLGIRLPSLFAQEAKSGNYVLDPERYKILFEELQSAFARHEKGLIEASTAKETEQLTQYLNKTVPGKTFASIHSRLSKKQRESIRALYEEGKVNFVVVEKELNDPKLYAGVGLYVDLNRDLDTQRFLRGASRVLAPEKNKGQADIVSFAELNPTHVTEQLASFEEAIETIPSNQVREELLKLSTEMQRTAIPGYASIEKAADETIEHILLEGDVPKSRPELENEYLLYQRMVRYRSHPAFIARIKRNPAAWKVFSDYLLTPAERAALDAIPHFLKGVMPPSKSPLYERIRKFRSDPKFIAKIQGSPEAWEYFQTVKFQNTRGYKKTPTPPSETAIVSKKSYKADEIQMAIEKAAQALINHLLLFRKMPTLAKQRSLYKSLYRYRNDTEKGNYRYIDDPILIAKLKQNPEAWEIFQNLTTRKNEPKARYVRKMVKLSPPQRIAKEVISYILEHNRLPLGESDIYERFHLHRDDPAFIQAIKENPKAWKLYSKLIQACPTPQEQAAQDFIVYVSTTEEPLSKKGGLYDRLLRFRGDPVLIAKLQEDPKVWERFQSLFKQNRTRIAVAPITPKEAAQRIIVYMLKHNDVPPSDSTLHTLFITYRGDPVVIKEIKANPKAWEIFSLSHLSPQERAAQIVINYISQEKKPLSKSTPIYKIFYRYRNDPIFIAKINENSEVYEFLKKLGIKLKDPNEAAAPAP